MRVNCLDDGYVVARVARETLGPDIVTLNLNNPSPSGCSVAVPADHFDDFEIRYAVSDCGTVNEKIRDFIESTNHITGEAQGSIVYTYDTDYTVTCIYDAEDTVYDWFRPLHGVGDSQTGRCGQCYHCEVHEKFRKLKGQYPGVLSCWN